MRVVSFKGKYVRIRSETLLYLGSVWKGTPQATELALYSWGPSRLSDDWSEVPVIASRLGRSSFSCWEPSRSWDDCRSLRTALHVPTAPCLSHDFWQIHFRGDKNVLGRRIELDGHPMTVVGVLPRTFELPASSTAVWTVLDDATLRFSNFMSRVGVVARLRDGATPAQLQSDLIDRSENAGYRFVQAPMKVVSLQSQWRTLLATYAGFVVLAVLCAGAIAWLLRSAAGGFGPVSLRGWQNFRWWAFFAAKSAALTASVYLFVWLTVHGLLGWVGRTVYPMADEVVLLDISSPGGRGADLVDCRSAEAMPHAACAG